MTIDVSSTSILATGKLSPAHPGKTVSVTLYVKNGVFEPVKKKTDTLNSRSRYLVSFPEIAGAHRCRITTRFASDLDHRPSSVSQQFDC